MILIAEILRADPLIDELHLRDRYPGVRLGAATAPIPGTCISKRPETHAFRFEHHDGARCVRTKHASPRVEQW